MKRIIASVVGLGICALCFIAGMKSAKPAVVEVMKPEPEKRPAMVADPDVRVVKKEDGERNVYIRKEDGLMIKYRFRRDMEFLGSTVYRLDEKGNPLSSKISDRKGNPLYKVSFGYRKGTGLLVEERVFDSMRKHLDADGREQPVHRFIRQDDGILLSLPLEEGREDSSVVQWVDAPYRDPFMN